MKKLIYILALAVLFGCNNESSEKDAELSTDSTGIVNKSIAASFDDKEFKTIKLPIEIDTNFILEVDTNDRVPYQQVRQLGNNILQHEISSGLSYDINSFCEIDSLKQEGKYNSYLEKLDIGMTKVAISFKLGVIDLGNGAKLFLWGVHNSSFEACPFFAGTTIIGTFVNANKQNTHFVIGEISGGGDPPSMGNDQVTSKINTDGKVEIKRISVNDDLDIPGEETTIETIVLKLNADKIEILDSKKQVKNTEKSNQ
ncbi:MAG: hypothetical protein ACXVC7_06370 [Bacteroidia bacterium]